MFDFISDLDEYFCEKYTGYDKMCTLKGYKMPLMQTSVVRNGKTYAYTLPAETMRLALQEEKEGILAQLKERMRDRTFSFTFHTVGIFHRLRHSKEYRLAAQTLRNILTKYKLTEQTAIEGIDISAEVWHKIYKGKFLPSKNLLFSLALQSHFAVSDVQALLQVHGYKFDFSLEKDVVISYLLEQKVFNREMIDAALKEYRIGYLFLK